MTETFSRVEEFMDWTSKTVFGEAEDNGPSELGRSVLDCLLVMCSNMITVGKCDANFVGHCMELCGKLIAKGE